MNEPQITVKDRRVIYRTARSIGAGFFTIVETWHRPPWWRRLLRTVGLR